MDRQTILLCSVVEQIPLHDMGYARYPIRPIIVAIIAVINIVRHQSSVINYRSRC